MVILFSSKHFQANKKIISAIEALKRQGVSPQDFRKRIAEQEKNVLADENNYYKKKVKNFVKGDLKPNALKFVKKNKELAVVYEQYQEALRKQHLYDFSDMIIAVVDALEQSEAFHATLLEQYQYILVDEHQDTNDGQNRLLELLSEVPTGDAPNLFTVGDDKQAIYRFQGASVENFLHFSQRFPQMQVIHLSDNYRSTQEILDTAHTLISAEEREQKHTELTARGDVSHASIDVHAFANRTQELAFIAHDIKKKITNGTSPQDIAIMYRQNDHLGDIKAALERESVPYTISSRQNLLEDPVMRKLFFLLHAIANPMDSASMGRALLIDFLGLDIRDVVLLFEMSRYGKMERSLFHLITTKQLDHVKGLVNKKRIVEVGALFRAQKSAGENMPFLMFFEAIVRESGFLKHLMARKNHLTHVRQLETLMQEIRIQMETKPQYRLRDFLAYIDTLMAYNLTINVPGSGMEHGVQLMTAHGAKGLEFEHVYITNAIHKVWDHKTIQRIFHLPINEDVGDINDERRLFYVALTRAKQDVTITYAKTDDKGKERLPTLFIDELATAHVHHHDHTTQHHDVAQQFRPRTPVLPHILDNEYIREKFLTTPLSVSALNNYMRSPVLYFFRNLVRLPQAQTKSLLFGNLIHHTLEKYFNIVKEQKKIAPVKELHACFERALEKEFLLAEYYDEIHTYGHNLLEDYWQEYHKQFALNILTEKKIQAIPFVLDDGREILLTGIIDKMELLDDGGVRVVDYKTGKPWSKKNKEDRQQLERQIVFYKLLLDHYEQSDGTKYVMREGVLDFVEKNDRGEYERKVFDVSDEQVKTLRKEINAFAKDVLDGTFLQRDVVRTRDIAHYLDLLDILKK